MTYPSKSNYYMLSAFIAIVCLIAAIGFNNLKPGKTTATNKTEVKDTPITIYTPKDIYYLYNDSITSESGNIHVTDGNYKAALIEVLTANDATKIK